MSLMSLSDELLLGVIDHVQSHRDMAALSQQCRRLQSLSDMVTRRKYRRIQLGTRKQLQAGFKMLLSILQKPRLGTYVHQLKLYRSPRHYGRAQDTPLITLDSRDLEKLKQSICRAGFSEATEQDAVLNVLLRDPTTMANSDKEIAPYAHALAALIISVSPNLQSLALCPVGWEMSKRWQGERGRSGHQQDYFFKYFMERANSKVGQVPYLQNLQQVEFLPDSDSMLNDERFYEEYDVYGSLNLVRRLPAIESVSFNAIIEPENSSVRIPSNSANYSKISIQRSILDYHMYCGVIESAKQLKELTFTIGGRASSDGSFRDIHPEAMFKSLLLHRNTLERLDFNIEQNVDLSEVFTPTRRYDRDPDHEEYEEEEYNFEWEEELADLEPHNDGVESLENASLRNFPKLKHISLGVHLLYFYARGIGNTSDHDPSQFSIADHLPPNLESLRIYGYEKGKVSRWALPDLKLDDHIAKLMEEKEKLPLLKRIEGIEECIPNDKMVEHPDNESELLWEPESEEEWTDYEY